MNGLPDHLIEYDSDNKNSIQVTLWAREPGSFAKALPKALEKFKDKNGEDLVAALLKHFMGNISMVDRYDTASGEKTSQILNPNGTRFYQSHFNKDGKLENLANGSPAERGFDENGEPRFVCFRNNGVINNGPKGEPGYMEIKTLDEYRGSRHYTHTVFGYAGREKVVYAESWNNGNKVKILSPQEIAAFMKQESERHGYHVIGGAKAATYAPGAPA
ncbi:MAG: hypothetical protein V1721_07680 [Pseudomonadota bacterium]